MKKWLPIFVLGLGVIFIAIQFVPVKKINPPVTGEIPAPAEVKSILERSCYDCHSNQTDWPWYGYIAPVSWLVASDVSEGRRHLNFSEWDSYSTDKRNKKLAKIVEEVKEGEMPLRMYAMMHPRAKLSSADIGILKTWAINSGQLGYNEKTGKR